MSAKLAEYKLEDAAKTAIGAVATYDVLYGVDENTIDFSCVLVSVSQSEPLKQNIQGSWICTLSVKVFSDFRKKSKEEHYEEIEKVNSVVLDDAFASTVGAAGEAYTAGRTNTTRNECWIYETILRVPYLDGQ